MLSFLDVYDRSVVHNHIGLSATAEDAAAALWYAFWKRQLTDKSSSKPVLRTDNGPQFIADVFEETCRRYGVEHERIPCRTPNKNAHIEAFHRILEDECLAQQEFETFTEGYRTVAEFTEFYNKTRIHSSIQYMPPKEFYQAFQSNNARLLLIRV